MVDLSIGASRQGGKKKEKLKQNIFTKKEKKQEWMDSGQQIKGISIFSISIKLLLLVVAMSIVKVSDEAAATTKLFPRSSFVSSSISFLTPVWDFCTESKHFQSCKWWKIDEMKNDLCRAKVS